MSIILAIDPGSMYAGWVVYDTDKVNQPVFAHGKDLNDLVLEHVRRGDYEVLAIEWMESSFGSHIGKEVTETLYWVGRFCEAGEQLGMVEVVRISRNKLRHHLTGKATANDTMVRGALVDRFGGVGGRSAAVGVKAAPGPLFGVVADEWQAVAVACCYQDGVR